MTDRELSGQSYLALHDDELRAVLADEALAALRPGPARRFLSDLATHTGTYGGRFRVLVQREPDDDA
jgi:hypothetical protein